MSSTGPSTRAVVRCLNNRSCGSGSICGIQNGKSLILTNAHVAGSVPGRIIKCEIEETGDKLDARVIMASYSSRTWTDWALLETVENYTKIVPVKLSKKRPARSQSHYTKGFPRCKAHRGTNITFKKVSKYTATWFPNAIGGQSGSGVWSDLDDICTCLLTWSIGTDGAGQPTASIYEQARNRSIVSEPRVEGMIELPHEFDLEDDERGYDDPVILDGFFMEANITDLPIWHEDDPVDPPVDPVDPPVDPVDPPVDPIDRLKTSDFVEYCRDVEELHEKWRLKFEDVGGDTSSNENTFGL